MHDTIGDVALTNIMALFTVSKMEAPRFSSASGIFLVLSLGHFSALCSYILPQNPAKMSQNVLLARLSSVLLHVLM